MFKKERFWDDKKVMVNNCNKVGTKQSSTKGNFVGNVYGLRIMLF